MIEVTIPKVFGDLFKPKRYKVYYGGRGGAKSHNIARALLVLGMQRTIRILCARELQVSIKDSVHALLSDIIRQYGLDSFYTITDKEIRGKNGTEFGFKGLKHNAKELKSYEGADYCWVEEAQNVSDNSWELLIPTIRKTGSEIWLSFNPKNPTDPTWQRFVLQADEDVLVKKVSWQDNPFFGEVMDKERLKLLKNDPEAYKHIWEGEFDTRFFGGVYSKWVASITENGRLLPSLYDPELLVHSAWDLGYDDSTAIFFWQLLGKEVRLIDYYENNGQDIEHYCDIVKGKGFKTYGSHFVPHDAANKLLAAGGRSIVQQAYAFGIKMRVVAATSQQNGIEAARKVLENTWIDADKCKDGMHALLQYQFEYDEERKIFKSTPLHDWSSHASDAFEIIGQVMREKIKPEDQPKPKFFQDLKAKDVFFPEKQPDKYERI